MWGMSWVTCESGSAEDQELDQKAVEIAQLVNGLLHK